MQYKNLLTSTHNRVLRIIINREKSRNSLSLETIDELKEVFENAKNDEAVRCMIITGAGEKAFISGADINEFKTLMPRDAKLFALNGQGLVSMIENFKKPVIAAVNGYALGGGCELAMGCHIRIASENALFGQPEIKLGIIPGYGGTQRIIQYLGKTKAMELLLLAGTITAAEALSMGLVNYVVSPDKLMEEAQAIGERISAMPPVAVAGIIASVNSYFSSANAGYEAEATAFENCISTKDFHEGVSAFLEKRKPSFRGE